MRASAPIGVQSASASLISDDSYYNVVKQLFEHATKCCLASVFIVDLNAHDDPDIKILQILKTLQDAVWRGIEVKLLIGGSVENLAIAESCHIARDVAGSLGIDCRLLANETRRGSHSKLVTVDDYILSGSHNWSQAAMSKQIQDSLLMKSSAMAAYMRTVFYQQWTRAGE